MAPLIVFTFLHPVTCLGRVRFLVGGQLWPHSFSCACLLPVTCLGQVKFLGRQLCCAHSFSSTCLLSLSGPGGFPCGPTRSINLTFRNSSLRPGKLTFCDTTFGISVFRPTVWHGHQADMFTQRRINGRVSRAKYTVEWNDRQV